MRTVNENLLSIRAFVLFDAVIKTGNFTAAAERLNIGQPAISHGIKQLENLLGVTLFERHRNGVHPTVAGQLLASKVSVGLDTIREGISEVQAMGKIQRKTVTLSFSTSLARFWFLPRVTRFKAQHPDIDIRCITHDSDRTLASENYDLSIPLGRANWPAFDRWFFSDETIYPVCGPEYAKHIDITKSPQEQSGINLIHLEEDYEARLDWRQWYSYFGMPFLDDQAATRTNDYSIVLHATQESQGIALGWHHIVAPLIQAGKLVKVGKEQIKTNQPFYIIAPAHRELSEQAELIKNWLIEEAQTNPLESPKQNI